MYLHVNGAFQARVHLCSPGDMYMRVAGQLWLLLKAVNGHSMLRCVEVCGNCTLAQLYVFPRAKSKGRHTTTLQCKSHIPSTPWYKYNLLLQLQIVSLHMLCVLAELRPGLNLIPTLQCRTPSPWIRVASVLWPVTVLVLRLL